MQGSLRVRGGCGGGAAIKINDDGFYNLIIGAADMGTGCDTTLAQVAAECLGCELDDIVVFGAETDHIPLTRFPMLQQHCLSDRNSRGKDM
ncbi:MAG: molybdopterin cofactor-binding domain-containing protein [Enterocloster clostridioformis]